jgi:hypothetical protein
MRCQWTPRRPRRQACDVAEVAVLAVTGSLLLGCSEASGIDTFAVHGHQDAHRGRPVTAALAIIGLNRVRCCWAALKQGSDDPSYAGGCCPAPEERSTTSAMLVAPKGHCCCSFVGAVWVLQCTLCRHHHDRIVGCSSTHSWLQHHAA